MLPVWCATRTGVHGKHFRSSSNTKIPCLALDSVSVVLRLEFSLEFLSTDTHTHRSVNKPMFTKNSKSQFWLNRLKPSHSQNNYEWFSPESTCKHHRAQSIEHKWIKLWCPLKMIQEILKMKKNIEAKVCFCSFSHWTEQFYRRLIQLNFTFFWWIWMDEN